jgi:hypothetical protein
MTKDRFRVKPINKYTPKNLQAQNERADDQIAPRAVTHSINALQQWALLTANLVQSGHRANETQMVERIRDRYVNKCSPRISYGNLDQIAAVESSDIEVKVIALKKRKHSVSPTGSLSLDTLHTEDTDEADMRQTKRRQAKSPNVSSVDDDDIYAQSSEWSFPSEDEVKVLQTVKATKTKT